MPSRVRDSIPERVVPGIHERNRETRKIGERGTTLERENQRARGTRNEEVPERPLTETRALRPFARFPRALLSLSRVSCDIARSHQGRAAEAASRVLNHLRLKRRDARSPRRAARSAALAPSAKRGTAPGRERGATAAWPTKHPEDRSVRTRGTTTAHAPGTAFSC